MYKSSSGHEDSRLDKTYKHDKKQYLNDVRDSGIASVTHKDKGKEHRRASAPVDKSHHHRKSKSRSRTHSAASGETLLLLLREQERDAQNARNLLRAAMDEVDASASRLAEAERERRELAQAQVTQRLQAHAATVQVQVGASRTKHELEMYKLQLEAAQREIARAQSVVQMMQTQRDDAERAAAKARTIARRLKEEQIVLRAREQGREEGYAEGVERARMLSEFGEDGREAIYYAIRSAGADPRMPGDGTAYIEDLEETPSSRHTRPTPTRSRSSTSDRDTEGTRPRDRTSPRTPKPPSETTRQTSNSSRSSRHTSVASPSPLNHGPPSPVQYLDPQPLTMPASPPAPPEPPSPPAPMPEPMVMPEPEVQNNVPDAYSPQPIPIPPPKQYATRNAPYVPRERATHDMYGYSPNPNGVTFPGQDENQARKDSMSSAGGYPSGSRSKSRARRDSTSTTSSAAYAPEPHRSRKDSMSSSGRQYAYGQQNVPVMQVHVPTDVDPYDLRGLGKPAKRASMGSSRSGVTGDVESELGRTHKVEETLMPYMPMPPPPTSYLQREAERSTSVPPQSSHTRPRRDSQSSQSSAGYGGYRPPSAPYAYQQPPPRSAPTPPVRSAPTPPVYPQTYGQPQQPVYSQPPAPAYGQPQAPAYGQPPPPAQPAYGRQTPTYGQPPAPIYGRASRGSHRRTRSASDASDTSTTSMSQFDLTSRPPPTRGPLSVIPEDANSPRVYESSSSSSGGSPAQNIYASHNTPQFRVQPPEEERQGPQRSASRSSKSSMYGNRRNVADWAESSSEGTPPGSNHPTTPSDHLLTPEYRPRNSSRENVASPNGGSSDSRRSSTGSSSFNIIIEPPSRPTSVSGNISGNNTPMNTNFGLLSPQGVIAPALPQQPRTPTQPVQPPFIPAMPMPTDSEPDDSHNSNLPPWIRQQQQGNGTPAPAQQQQSQGIYGQAPRRPSQPTYGAPPEPPVPVPGPQRNNYASSTSSGSETDTSEADEPRRTPRASRSTTPTYAVAPQPPGFSYPASPLAGVAPTPGTPGAQQQRRVSSVYGPATPTSGTPQPPQARSGVRRASVSYATPGSAAAPVHGTPMMGGPDGGVYGLARSTSESDGDVDPATLRNTLANAGSMRY
ncbi:hypothetical protein EV122DRAFT_275462 [Schizophyllum commune]